VQLVHEELLVLAETVDLVNAVSPVHEVDLVSPVLKVLLVLLDYAILPSATLSSQR